MTRHDPSTRRRSRRMRLDDLLAAEAEAAAQQRDAFDARVVAWMEQGLSREQAEVKASTQEPR